MSECEVAVIGGGMVGAAVAYGLARRGVTVDLLDEGDVAHRAARGNFGLVWVQSKGVGCPEYAAWTRRSADRWENFASELKERTGIDVGFRRPGGVHLCLGERAMEARSEMMKGLEQQAQGAFKYEMLDHKAASDLLPGLGEAVSGGSYCPLDGHANPLYLLRALHAGFLGFGGRYHPNRRVTKIHCDDHGFRLDTHRGTVQANKVLIAAGLASTGLGREVGIEVPVKPNRGQILVSEKLRPFLELPTTFLRQTVEGGVLMGDSKEDVGFDEGTTTAVMGDIARRAVSTLPWLRHVRVVRAWGALRVMTPDGVPVYEQSEKYPGAFGAACHSGITLAAVHANNLAGWIHEGALPSDMKPFNASRFDVQTAH